eukprot:365713-Chlamydomonas_euryale.AAC.3
MCPHGVASSCMPHHMPPRHERPIIHALVIRTFGDSALQKPDNVHQGSSLLPSLLPSSIRVYPTPLKPDI